MNMTMSNIGIVQSDNVYYLYLPNGIHIAQIAMPPDRCYMADGKALAAITKVMAWRWEVPPRNGKG